MSLKRLFGLITRTNMQKNQHPSFKSVVSSTILVSKLGLKLKYQYLHSKIALNSTIFQLEHQSFYKLTLAIIPKKVLLITFFQPYLVHRLNFRPHAPPEFKANNRNLTFLDLLGPCLIAFEQHLGFNHFCGNCTPLQCILYSIEVHAV